MPEPDSPRDALQAWKRFVRQMRNVMPGSPTAIEFARQAFIGGWSANPVQPVLREPSPQNDIVVDREDTGDKPGITPLPPAERIQAVVECLALVHDPQTVKNCVGCLLEVARSLREPELEKQLDREAEVSAPAEPDAVREALSELVQTAEAVINKQGDVASRSKLLAWGQFSESVVRARAALSPREGRMSDNPQTENARGEWVPAIPLPYLFTLHTRCRCGKRFYGRQRRRALRRYEEHYALRHILKPEASEGERNG